MTVNFTSTSDPVPGRVQRVATSKAPSSVSNSTLIFSNTANRVRAGRIVRFHGAAISHLLTPLCILSHARSTD
jgi:hypothetical protein